MLTFRDIGVWTLVQGAGPSIHDELRTVQATLSIPCQEGTAHVWANVASGLIEYLRPSPDGSGWVFLRGWKTRVLEQLARRCIHVVDHTPPWAIPGPNAQGWEELYERGLRDDLQRWACDQIVGHSNGIAKLFVRAGKSYIFGASWVRLGRPKTLVLIPRADIIRQMQAEMSDFLGEPVGHICSALGAPLIKPYTLVSLPTLLDRKRGLVKEEFLPVLREVQAVFCDEAHISGNQLWVTNMSTAQRVVQWALSSTPYTDDPVKNFELEGWFGPCRINVDCAAGAAAGYIASMLVRWTPVHVQTLSLGSDDQQSWADYYRTHVVKNTALNAYIAHLVQHHVAHGDGVIVFVDRVEHGKILCAACPGLVNNTGSISSALSAQTKADFNTGKIKAVVTTKRWREGLTLNANVIINAEGLKVDHAQEQRFGRGLIRKEDGRPLVLYDFEIIDQRGTLHRHSKSREAFLRRQRWQFETLPSIASTV